MNKMSLSEAKGLSLLKWEFIKKYCEENQYVDNLVIDQDLLEQYPELREFPAYCAMCEYKFNKSEVRGVFDNCAGCPLIDNGMITCYDSRSLFSIWWSHPTIENAQNMIDRINQIKIEE